MNVFKARQDYINSCTDYIAELVKDNPFFKIQNCWCGKKHDGECMTIKVDIKKELDTLHNQLNTLIQTYVVESRQRDIALSKIWEAFDLLDQVVK